MQDMGDSSAVDCEQQAGEKHVRVDRKQPLWALLMRGLCFCA